MRTKITHIALFAAVVIIVFTLIIIPVVAQTNDSQNATSSTVQATSTSSESPTIVLNWYSTGIVLALILLLGIIFYLLINYSHRLDNTGYLSVLFHESLENIEYERRASRIQQKRSSGEFIQEVKEDSSWREKNPMPQFTPELQQRFPGSSLTYDAYTPVQIPILDKNDPFFDKADEYKKRLDEWDNKVNMEADKRFREKLRQAQAEAAQMAELGLNIDAGLLKGRGPEFVLEFTTVVVIIFAAVILGVLGVLSTEQIGTLLAAIAGYVLGRATTRAKEGAPATTPAAASDAVNIINAVKGTQTRKPPEGG